MYFHISFLFWWNHWLDWSTLHTCRWNNNNSNSIMLVPLISIHVSPVLWQAICIVISVAYVVVLQTYYFFYRKLCQNTKKIKIKHRQRNMEAKTGVYWSNLFGLLGYTEESGGKRQGVTAHVRQCVSAFCFVCVRSCCAECPGGWIKFTHTHTWNMFPLCLFPM